MICSNCNGENLTGSTVCVHCGRELAAALSPAPMAPPASPDASGAWGPPAPAAASDPAAPPPIIAQVIPYKNVPALVAYYLGVFSVIPCIGLPLGIAAVVLGILGLRRAKKHPESKGKVHAWVGIIVGGIFGLIYLALGVVLLIAAVMAPMLRDVK